MTGTYHQLALARVRPGMVLSDVLQDAQGQVLLPEGTVLTEAMLALMPRHGIDMLPVLAELAEQASPEQELAARSHHEARIAHLFRKTDADAGDDWATSLLQRFVLDFRTGRQEPDHE